MRTQIVPESYQWSVDSSPDWLGVGIQVLRTAKQLAEKVEIASDWRKIDDPKLSPESFRSLLGHSDAIVFSIFLENSFFPQAVKAQDPIL
jgi:hypothetical protein